MRDSPSILPPIDIIVFKNKNARALQTEGVENQSRDEYSIEKSYRPRFNDTLPLYQEYLKKKKDVEPLSLIESSILALPNDANFSFPQLRELDLSGLNLNGLNLSKADLSGTNLTGANLEFVFLYNANLTKANLTKVDLTKVKLGGANLTNANLNSATLKGVNLTKAKLIEAILSFAFLNNANLTNADLTKAELTGANLTGADLSGANLGGVNSYLLDLSNANLSGAKLIGADLTGANLNEANLTKADLTKADLHRADLTNANLSGANLSNADLSNANLEGAKFARVIENSMNNGTAYRESDFDIEKFCDLLKRLNLVQIKEVLGNDNEVPARKYLEDLQISSKDDKLKSANIQTVLDVVAYLERKIGISSPSSNPEPSREASNFTKEGSCSIS